MPSDFTRVLAAESVSNFGSMLSRIAIPWLAALLLQATPMQMAALVVADVVAAALGSLVLGSLIDRAGKRAVMLVADLARCAVLAVLALAVWRGSIGFALLVVGAAASGLLTVAFELARSAWVAQCVDAADLPRRNAQLSVAGSVSEVAAFTLGGWLYQGVGAALSLAFDALSYAVSALALRGVREVAATPHEPTHGSRWRVLVGDAVLGLRTVASLPSLRALVCVEVLLAFGMSLSGTTYMIYVSRELAVPTGVLGMVFALGGVGAVVGASLAPRLGRRLGPGRAMTFGLAALALGAAFVPVATGAGWIAIALLVAQQLIGDAGHTVHDVHDRTLRQTAVAGPLLARVDAGIRSAGQFARLAGAAAGGGLGVAFGTRSVLAIAAVSFALAATVAAVTLGKRSVPAGAAG